MQTRLSTRRQLELMQQLQQAADLRAGLESSTAAALQDELSAAAAENRVSLEQFENQFCRRRRELENEYGETKSAASLACRKTLEELKLRHEQQTMEAERTFNQLALTAERKKKESEWQALAVFDAAKDGPRQMLEESAKRLHSRMLQVEGLARDAHTILAMRHQAIAEVGDEDSEGVTEQDESESLGSAEDRLQQTISRLHRAVLEFQAQRLPSVLLEGTRPIGWCLFAILFAVFPMGWLTDWRHWLWPPAALAAGTGLAGLVYLGLGRRAQRQSLTQFELIQSLLVSAHRQEQQVRDEAQARSREEAKTISLAKHHDLEAATEQRARELGEAEAGRDEQFRKCLMELERSSAAAQTARDELLAAADERFPPLLDKLAEDRRKTAAAIASKYERRVAEAQAAQDAAWASLAENWKTSFQQVSGELASMRSDCKKLFPDWSTTAWESWTRPVGPPPAIQFGRCPLPLEAVKNGLSADKRLVPEETELDLPALMTLDEQPRLVISARGEGRRAAVEMLQAVMLRFLTAMPAGKLRFTIVDPSALGENFATFMHLTDYDEHLVGKRIWTDSRQIDERLSLLADHMEKVLQKYLRNEFETIHEYNQQAGEVSEPYHVLVVANFPAGLSDASIRKLMTIATTGPRCGVYTLMSIDEQLKLPNELKLDQLLDGAVNLKWLKDRLVWQYPLYEKLALEPDRLPPREKLNKLLQHAGQESREASRVEVPFEIVAPAEGEIWSGSTAHELVVPVGRAGAKELQAIRLGRGTSQHMLVAGKTGSGKSTLLHTLVTNAALHFSPDELEFYLIDFKKGVEFKTYATGSLPHARVIAIESEREFGVSVLQRLDEELRRRGERFRELGVQDLAGYRGKKSEVGSQGPERKEEAVRFDPLPRVLLVIDEFQEMFVADDKLSQDAALLLDRLVRQGRAFGIHVLLGSQTLAGAYSLARSTLGQMAVRIALECSDADAHLILSDENTAARLLNRPGEAIYNDQNGLVEGNSPFQIAWLPDSQRQQYLETIRNRQQATGKKVEPPIVFEGNAPADLRGNEALLETLERSADRRVAEPTVWLGSAVRIEPPTQFTFRRQGGNHLMVVGQDESAAVGILATAAVALAAQYGSGPAAITVLDGSRAESLEKGAWAEVVAALPYATLAGSPREATAAVSSLAEEVTRRSLAPDQQYEPHYLIVHDLAQFRDLRQQEEDFGFSSLKANGVNGKPAPVDKQFRNLLREGPAVGVHVLLWCDSHNSLIRFIDRLTMREFDFRVALQMSSVDSTSLIDSPAASRLGEHRAIFYRDDLGTQVKFRPYGRPAEDWLAWASERLAQGKLARS
ncbi:MAG: DNA translocase FtsK [Planctomycetales bacterium]|nr:DNA translocase FtsK [Planctomycetales bacterium]